MLSGETIVWGGECSWKGKDTLYKQTTPSQPRVVWNLFLLLLLWLVDVTFGSSFSRMASDLYLLQKQNCQKVQ